MHVEIPEKDIAGWLEDTGSVLLCYHGNLALADRSALREEAREKVRSLIGNRPERCRWINIHLGLLHGYPIVFDKQTDGYAFYFQTAWEDAPDSATTAFLAEHGNEVCGWKEAR